MMAAIASWYALIDGGCVTNASVGGTADAITLTCSPTVDALAAGQSYAFVAGGTNTGAVTLTVDSTTTKALRYRATALTAGDIASGDLVVCAYDGTYYEMITAPRLLGLNASILTADGTGAIGDYLLSYDVSTSLPKKVLFSVFQTLFAASQAQQETGTSAAVNVTPAVQHFHDSAAKAWVQWDASSGTPTVGDSYNVLSLTDVAVGTVQVNIDNDLSGTNYAPAGMAQRAASNDSLWVAIKRTTNPAAGALRVVTSSDGASLEDSSYASVIIFGDMP